MGNAYTYYSFEEFGRGYIGARGENPVGDDAYMGTYSDTEFNPTQKIILAEYETMDEALEAEVLLHAFYEVDTNPHFANKARQTSNKFYYDPTGEVRSEEARQKMKDSWTEERRVAQAERMADQNRSERHREMMRTRNPGVTPESKARIIELNKSRAGQPLSQEHRDKISKAGRGKVRTPEQRERYRQAALKREEKKRRG